MPRSRLPLFVVTSVGKLHYAGSTSCCVPKLLFKRLLASLLACSLARSLAYLLASSLACLLGRLPARLLACFLARSLACLPARLLTCLLPCLLARPCLLGCLLAGCSNIVFFLLRFSFECCLGIDQFDFKRSCGAFWAPNCRKIRQLKIVPSSFFVETK